MDIKDRLVQYLEYKKINHSEFERVLALGRGRIYNLKSLGSEILARIKAEYPDISLEWLITGNGEMLVSSQNIKLVKKKTEFQLLEEKVEKTLKNMEKRMKILENKKISSYSKTYTKKVSKLKAVG